MGDVMTKVAVADSVDVGTMLSSGVSIMEALDICARTAGNKVIKASISRFVRRFLKGVIWRIHWRKPVFSRYGLSDDQCW